MIRFLADECIFDCTVAFLRDRGWEVTTVKELGLQGAKDPLIFSQAQALGAVLLTRDLEFGDIRRFPPSRHQGIIVLKMTYRDSREVHATLGKLLAETEEEGFKGTLFIVDREKWRRRKKP